MITTAQDLAAWLSRFAAQAAETGYTKGYRVEVQIDPGGLLVIGRSPDGEHQATRVIEWSDVFEHGDAVSAVLDEVIGELEDRAAHKAQD